MISYDLRQDETLRATDFIQTRVFRGFDSTLSNNNKRDIAMGKEENLGSGNGQKFGISGFGFEKVRVSA
jgi:hypothetical protein